MPTTRTIENWLTDLGLEVLRFHFPRILSIFGITKEMKVRFCNRTLGYKGIIAHLQRLAKKYANLAKQDPGRAGQKR